MSSEQLVAGREKGEHTAATAWRWSQRWRHVFFAHWRIPTNQLRPLLPPAVEIATWEGEAWLSAVAFRLQNVRLRALPPVGPCSNFLELNLRTYVRCHGEVAIYFLSIHAGSRLAVRLAGWLTPLPYAFARTRYEKSGNAWRFDSRLPADPARPLFRAEFQEPGERAPAVDDPLDRWLLERYCAYMTDRRGRLHRMVVMHPPWQAAVVGADVGAERLGAAQSLDLADSPERCHFSPTMQARLWPTEVIH